jgi:hypothetical protein
MKLNRLPEIYDNLVLTINNNKTNVTISNIIDHRYDVNENIKHTRYICEDKYNNKYQFIVFKDMKVSKVYKFK